MIKFVLVIYAMTASGPAMQPVAKFVSASQCDRVGQTVLIQLKNELKTNNVTYRCLEVTEV